MGQLIIKREKSMVGMAVQLNCFVNERLICKIKNGEEAICDIEDGVVDFKCRLTANPMSDVISIDTRGRAAIQIIVKQGAWNPQITVVDQDAVVTVASNTFSRAYSLSVPKDTSPFTRNTPFTPTRAVGSYFGVDENTRLWAVGKGLIPSLKNSTLYDYEDIIDFELIEDGTSITKGGLGRAAVGGLLFGGVGAIVGGVTGGKRTNLKCTSLMVKITVNNMRAPVEYIKLITSTVDKRSYAYKTAFKNAQEIISLLQVICSQREAANWTEEPESFVYEVSTADEIRKFKVLLDDGIITEEEFNEKKKQLLGL